MQETVIHIDNLSKTYTLGAFGAGNLTDRINMVFNRMKKREKALPVDENARSDGKFFKALDKVSFEVKRGEIVGVIGKNGAGKSTLLKIISQISTPTRGEIRIKGRVASLLEVGTGFHPELTGRENIYLNGAILGMSKNEINSKLNEIIEFSGIKHHIDTPVKRYSSGMKVRLGFAVAAHLEPEILIIDEVLAVGDAEFQSKCLGKMQDVAGSGRTILFVSHNLSAVRNLCHRAVVLNNGQLEYDGGVNEALQYYAQITSGDDTGLVTSKSFNGSADLVASLLEAQCYSETDGTTGQFEYDRPVWMKVKVKINEKKHDTVVGVIVEDIHRNLLIVSTNEEYGEHHLAGKEPGEYMLEIKLPAHLLKPSAYTITLSVRGDTGKAYQKEESCLRFEIVDTITYRGIKNRYRKQALIAPVVEWKLIETR